MQYCIICVQYNLFSHPTTVKHLGEFLGFSYYFEAQIPIFKMNSVLVNSCCYNESTIAYLDGLNNRNLSLTIQ